MLKRLLAATAMIAIAGAACASAPETQAQAQAGLPLNDLYKHLHSNPELSFKEKHSSALLAQEAESLGFNVTTGLGQEWVEARAMAETGYIVDGVGGYGVVAVMKNGDGPTLLIRADTDALPVPEQTGVPYASTKMDEAWVSGEVPVMHACGHDIHMTVWTGVARELVANRDKWSGTLIMILQPAEELGLGARAMLDDGLFEDFPYPDYNLALHVSAGLPAGHVGYAPGYAMANVDSVDVHIHGVGGHGAYPHATKDPVVVAAHTVTALQTLMSREVNPLDSGVVTVGMIAGGHKHNIISEKVVLKLTVRSYTDQVRKHLLSGIERIAKAQALSAGIPEEKAPTISVKDDYTPAVYNDPDLTERIRAAISLKVGDANMHQTTPVMGGEDFSRYGRTDPKIPSVLFWLGAVEPAKYKASQQEGGKALPSLHSPFFAPDYEPTIQTGVTAMTAAAMDILGK